MPIIFNHNVFDLGKMTQAKLEAQVKHLCEKKKPDRAQYEQTWKASLPAEEKSKKKDNAKRKDEADVA